MDRYFKISFKRLFANDFSDESEYFRKTNLKDMKDILLAICHRYEYKELYKDMKIESFVMSGIYSLQDYKEKIRLGQIHSGNKLRLYNADNNRYCIFSYESCGDVSYYAQYIVEEIQIKELEVES